MSGGAYQNIMWADAGELLESSKLQDIECMAHALEDFGNLGAAAAAKTFDIYNRLLAVRDVLNQIEKERDDLAQVWKAVDYMASMDISRGQVEEELQKYND